MKFTFLWYKVNYFKTQKTITGCNGSLSYM